MTARFRLQLLGAFALYRGAEEIPIAGKKARALLAYLALHSGAMQSRERLATLLWGERFEKQARQSLRQTIVALRKEIGDGETDLLVTDREQLGMSAELIETDVARFEHAVQLCKVEELTFAAELYRDDLLPDFTVGAEEFDSWAARERERLRELAVHAFAKLARHLAETGDCDRALAVGERLLNLDPAQESSHRLMIELAGRFRGRAAAQRQFQRATAALKRELDAAPSPETRRLLDEIKKNGHSEPPMLSAVAAAHTPAPIVASRRLPMWAVFTGGIAAVAAAFAVYWGIRGEPSAASGPTSTPRTIAVTTVRSTGARIPALSMIVLPFQNYGDAATAPFADILADDLTTDLSCLPGAFVISRSTALTYRDKPTDAKQVGRDMGVRYVVAGGVRITDGRLRVNAELVDTETGAEVWARRFTADLDSWLTVEDEIVAGLVQELNVEMAFLEAARSARERPHSPGLDDLLLRGRAARLRSPTVETLSEQRAFYEHAFQLAPDSGWAASGLAAGYAIGVLLMQTDTPEQDLDAADALIGRALAETPRCYFCWHVKALIHRGRGQFEEALAAWRRTLEINPNYPHAHAQIGSTLIFMGRAEETEAHVRQAMRLSPRDPQTPLWLIMLAGAELQLGHDQQAIDLLRRAAVAAPGNPRIYRLLAAALELQGDDEGAHEAAARFRGMVGASATRFPEERYATDPVFLAQSARIGEALQRAGL
jgi:DNA-binding SARP family transcriptional activator/TolB-like protein/cytochrome c-type biogenesis protein CcmH/NrfG